jgi:hypothetical protein
MEAALQVATCSVGDCDRPVLKAGLCNGHYRRRERGAAVSGPLRPYRREAWASLTAAALAYADAEDDAAFKSAEVRLREAAKAYVAEGRS